MSKIYVLALALLMLCGVESFAKRQVDLSTQFVDPTPTMPEQEKGPVQVPIIWLDENILYFETPCDGCLLNVLDASNTVVYSVVIPVGTTSLVLPSNLSGTYELQIIQGNYCFYGDIDL